jgi:hypothetical protein
MLAGLQGGHGEFKVRRDGGSNNNRINVWVVNQFGSICLNFEGRIKLA